MNGVFLGVTKVMGCALAGPPLKEKHMFDCLWFRDRFLLMCPLYS